MPGIKHLSSHTGHRCGMGASASQAQHATDKLKHWRASPELFAPKAAPVLEFAFPW